MKHLTKNQLLEKARIEAKALQVAGRANLLISLVILNECFEFGPEYISEFVERYEETLEFYNNSKDYQKLLTEWNDYFKDLCGVDVLYHGEGET